MVKRIFAFFSILAVGALTLPLIALAEDDGFRGIKWGADISTLKDMQYLVTDVSNVGVKKYTRKGDELKIGGAVLESIEYGFWQGKFSSILIQVKGYTNFSALKESTVEKFGTGYKPDRIAESYKWFGEITTMKLDYDEISKVGELYMCSKEISEQQKKYNAENAKKEAETGS